MARCSMCHQSLVPKEGDVCQICRAKMKHGGSAGGYGSQNTKGQWGGSGNSGNNSGWGGSGNSGNNSGWGGNDNSGNNSGWGGNSNSGNNSGWGGNSNSGYGNSGNNGSSGNSGGGKGGLLPKFPKKEEQEQQHSGGIRVDNVKKPSRNESQQVFSTSGKSGGYVTGIVQNYQTVPSDDSPMERWFKSFFNGVPYTKEPIRVSFNVLDRHGLQEMNLGGVNSVNVQIYGSISSGDINNGNEVEVWGKMSSNHVLYANRIRNIRNNVETEINRATPAGVIRFVTCSIIALILLVIFGIMTGVSGGGSGSLGTNLSSMLGGLLDIIKVLGFVIFFIFGYGICKRFRVDMTTWLIVCAIVAVFLVPELGPILITLAGLAFLFKTFIK